MTARPRPGDASRIRLAGPLLALLATALILIGRLVWPRPAPEPSAPRSPESALPFPGSPGLSSQPPRTAGDGKVEPAPPPDAAWEPELRRLRDLAARLAALSADGLPSPDDARRGEIRRLLDQLRETLRALPNDIATSAIQAFLGTGEDAATGLGFAVGEGGLLDEAPTLRTFLLDLLPELDPVAAVAVAESVLAGSAHPDEWALALRNLAWQDHDGSHRPRIVVRFREMLDHPEWLARPSAGFLEAFDLAAHLGDPDALREVGSVLGLRDAEGRLADNGVTHAAFLALDRITAAHPAQTLALIRDDPAFLSWAPGHRGALLSRADPRDPAQAALLSAHLRRTDLAPEERAAFFALFPNGNGTVTPGLVTATIPPLRFDQVSGRDQAALELVRAWRTDPALSRFRTDLAALEARLAEHAASSP